MDIEGSNEKPHRDLVDLIRENKLTLPLVPGIILCLFFMFIIQSYIIIFCIVLYFLALIGLKSFIIKIGEQDSLFKKILRFVYLIMNYLPLILLIWLVISVALFIYGMGNLPF